MLKKAQMNKAKDQVGKLKTRLEEGIQTAQTLVDVAGMPLPNTPPPDAVLENLMKECEDHDFWLNFKKAAPMLFCAVVEGNADVKQARDVSFMDELIKTRAMMTLLSKKLSEGDANIDIIEYSLATQQLENKVAVLKAMNTTVEGDSDDRITFNVQGTTKAIRIDMVKLREAITFESTVEERQSTKEDHLTKIEDIDESLKGEDFLNKAVELVGTIEKNENKTFKKDSFIKIFKYSGEYAKGF